MRFRLAGSVTIPKRPSSVGGLISWARGVNRTLQELRDRKIVGSVARRASATSHPWKVTANGDDSVTVAKGKILSWSNQSAPPTDTIPIYYHLKEFKNYAGGIVESINANGVIYGSIPFIQAEVLYEADSGAGSLLLSQRIVPDVSATLSVAFATELPVTGNVFIFEIAKVTFADGVATVSDQVLENNPQMWAFDLQIIPPA